MEEHIRIQLAQAFLVWTSMPNPWGAKPPRSDVEYFERMTRAIFTAGLNWRMIEKKWPNFRKAFSGFTLTKVAKLSDKNVRALLQDESIVRNEKKIRATIHNAEQFLALEKEFGSFRDYLSSFHKGEGKLQEDLQTRFQHVGPSTARMFLWAVAYPLTPNAEEKKWMSGHKHE